MAEKYSGLDRYLVLGKTFVGGINFGKPQFIYLMFLIDPKPEMGNIIFNALQPEKTARESG
jgi:hypothetical protein